MFNARPLTSEIIKKVSCPGTHDHLEVSLKGKSSDRSCVMIRKYMDLFAERVKKMTVYEDDVWVVTFPKCGTTWTQEMVWMVNNDLDYKTALDVYLIERFPFLELHGVLNKFDGDSVGDVEKLPRPRHIKSHLPMFLLPDQLFTVKPKIVYVARNPKDLATSFFHHYRHIVGYEGTKEDFVEAFLADQIIYAPYNQHVLDFWKIRDEPNIFFTYYEDMKRNLPDVIKKLMTFFGKNYSDSEIDKLCKHLSVESMRSNPSTNYDGLVELAKSLNANGKSSGKYNFIRKGEVGSYKEEQFKPEMDKKFEDFISRPELFESGFEYKF